MKDNSNIIDIKKTVDSMKEGPIKEAIKKDLVNKTKKEILK